MIAIKWSLVLFLIFLLFALIPTRQSQQLGLKRPTGEPKPKKNYPFHKITRISADDDDDADDEIDEENDDKGYFFEKINKANVPIIKSPPVLSDAVQDDIEAEDAEVEESKKRISSGFFGFFTGSSSNQEKSLNTDKDDINQKSTEQEYKKDGNGIINWLQSFQISSNNDDGKSINEESNNWLEYLNRWPINTIFPFGQIEKYNFPPKNGKSDGYHSSAVPISDEHFANILGNLPSFVVNPIYVMDIDCRQQLQILQRQLRGHKIWAMQMLDSSAKIPSGILRGNINQFGDFDMCTQIKTVVKVTKEVSVRIKGKYCLAHIEIQSVNDQLKIPVHLSHGRGLWNSHLGDPSHFAPRYSIVNWGTCIPNLCPATVIRDTIDLSLRPYNQTGIYFHVEIDENDCFIRNSTSFKKLIKTDNKVSFTIGYFLMFISLVITAGLVDNRKYLNSLAEIFVKFLSKLTKQSKVDELKTDETKEESTSAIEQQQVKDDPVEKIEESIEEEELTETPLIKQIILSFSPKRSIIELFSSSNDTQFAIFHILKIICTFMLYVCLKYLMIGHLPVLNRDKLVKSLDIPISILFRSPIIYLDILLMISGFLKSYKMCLEMEEKSHIYVLKRMSAKILRYLPTLYAVLFFQTWLLPHLGSGPLWSNLIGRNQKLCDESMWRNLFGVQNVINFEDTCSPLTIQHSVELQLYLLAPLIVWLFYCNSDVGFMVYGGINAMSVAARYSRTNLEHLSLTIFHGIHVSKFYRTANLLYSSPIPRATPFLIGIGAGILHKTSGNEWKDMSRVGLISGWITAITSIIWCFWYPINSINTDFIYNSIEAASYASWSPLLFSVGLIWIIFMLPAICNNGEQSTPLHKLLTVKPILFLSRISYPMQLVTYIVVLYFTADVKETNRYSIADLINFSEIATIILYSTLLSIFIDIPIKNTQKIILDKILPDKPPSLIHIDDETIDTELGNINDDDEEHEEIDEHEEITESQESEEAVVDIWGSDPEEEEKKYLLKRNSLSLWNSDEISKTETDIEPTSDSKDNLTSEMDDSKQDDEEEEEEEEEEDEEITEDDEVIRRPDTPEKPPSPKPPSPPIYRRRRFN